MEAIKIEEYEKKAVIKKGVRQGCSLCPLIFILLIQYVLNDIKEKCRIGIEIHFETIQKLRFADVNCTDVRFYTN